MENIIILGTTQFSVMIHKLIEHEKLARVVAYTINSEYIEKLENQESFNNLPLVPFESIETSYSTKEYKILNTLGYSRMNNLRMEKFEECKSKGYMLYNYVSNNANVYSTISGEGNLILPGSFIGNNVEIGNSNVFYTASVITHDVVIGNNSFFAASTTVGGNVLINNNCFFA
jgi:acetyltransferase-like isoleucine patch superfamily enzyme